MRPINYGDREVSAHRKRVSDDGGTFSPNNAAYVIDKLYDLPKPNLLTMATAGKSDKMYSIYPENGDGDFTVTRASTATFINEDGKIETAAANVPRFDFSDGKPVLLTEDAGENLLTHPLTMSDFTQSGATLEGDPSTAGDEKFTGFTHLDVGWTDNLDGSYSCDGSNNNYSILSQNIGALQLRFYKIELTLTGSNGNHLLRGAIGYNDYTSSVFYDGSYVLYVLHGSDANANFNIIANPGFTGTISNISVKEVQGFAAPSVDYPTGALKLVEDGSNGKHEVNKTFSPDGNKYASSIFIKSGERTKVRISGGNYNSNYADFDLISGTVINSVGLDFATIKQLSNGWYRCTVQSGGTLNYGVWVYLLDDNGNLSYQGDGTSGVYVAFPQLEQNSFASSFMFSGVEDGSTSLRSADNFSLLGYDDLPNGDFTMYWEGSFKDLKLINNNGGILMHGTGSNSFGMSVRKVPSDYSLHCGIRGVTTKTLESTINPNNYYKIALVYNSSGNSNLYINGINAVEGDITGSGYVIDTRDFEIGGENMIGGNIEFLNTNTNSTMIFTRALTEAEAIKLTTP